MVLFSIAPNYPLSAILRDILSQISATFATDLSSYALSKFDKK